MGATWSTWTGVVCLVAGIARSSEARAEPTDITPPETQEVHVRGARPEPSETRLSVLETREVPGGLGDPARAISALPGVAPMSRGAPYLYVRGAPPWNTGFLVDGVRVPLLFHAGVASSILQPALVGAIDFFPSAAPARYGGFAGAIMEEQTTAPNDRFHGEAVAKAYEAGALAESPFAEARGTALVAFRYGYPQLVLAIVSPDQQLGYWDYQSRVNWTLGERDRVGIFALGSHDHSASLGVESLAADFHRFDVRYDHDFGQDVNVRAAMTVGWSSLGASPIYVDDWSYAARVEAEAWLSPRMHLRAGTQLQLDAYGLASNAAPTAMLPDDADPPLTSLTAGGYADVVWAASRRVEVTPGVRFDVYRSIRADPSRSGTAPALEPRLAVRVTLAPGVAWLSSIGLAHQFPQLRVGVAPAAVSIPGFRAADVHLQTSAQVSEGIEMRLPAAITMRTTAFGSVTTGMTDLAVTCYERATGTRAMPGPPMYLCADDPVEGIAYGLELSLRRSLTQRLTAWLSYTLSRATERYLQPGDVHTILSPFDRTHVLSAIAAYEIAAGWRAGARLLAYSGTPDFEVSSGQRFASAGGYRFPPFLRLDVRVEKRWVLGPDRSIALVFEVQNATASREADRLDCGPPYAPPGVCRASSSPAVTIPSVGLEGEF
jgi:hypothetical protein